MTNNISLKVNKKYGKYDDGKADKSNTEGQVSQNINWLYRFVTNMNYNQAYSLLRKAW